MMQTCEQRIARSCRAILSSIEIGGDVTESIGMHDLLTGLEYFLPEVLAEVYPYWKSESLDGFFVYAARKTRVNEMVFMGLCVLISDQTVTPFHVSLRSPTAGDELEWMECRHGNRGDRKGGMDRVHYRKWNWRIFAGTDDPAESIDWAFRATFGKRVSDPKT